MDRVYICFRDNGYEGKSEPLFATTDANLAEAYLNGAQDAYAVMKSVCLTLHHKTKEAGHDY